MIIDELHGEKIDIFQWSDDITELVKNALAPAEVNAVLPGEDERSLLVVVDPDQLSLAIGKRGKNARLAVKLTNHKIDIKTREELEKLGYDYDELLMKAEARREELRREAARREIERLEAEAKAAEERRLAAAAKLAAERAARGEEEAEDEDLIPEEMQEVMRDRIRDEIAMKPDESEEETAAAPAEETAPAAVEEPAPVSEPEIEEEEAEEETPAEKPAASKRHADLEEMAAKNTYVSVFEKLTETSKPKQAERPKRKKKKNDEDEYKVRNKDLEEQIKKNLAAVDNRPIYSEEELAEIEAAQLEEEEREYDFDYDEYEDYYDEDNN